MKGILSMGQRTGLERLLINPEKSTQGTEEMISLMEKEQKSSQMALK